jgi:NitT/TauT family transport system permease protein
MPTERLAPQSLLERLAAGKALPVMAVTLVIVAIWYVAAFFMNLQLQEDAFANAGVKATLPALVAGTMNEERPRLPAPHQIVAELDKTVLEMAPSSKRSLVYHGVVTLQSTLAVLIVHAASLEKSLMPWIIASQTVPIIALAPMIVVIMNQFDVTGLVPKATISAYLSFFPVTVGMVKGLRSPDPLQLDLMRTYSASRFQTFMKLRAPASVPFLFASLKVAVAASLVGAVVAEMTKSEDGGFGARLLAGSYYGQTIQIWAALFAAAFCAAMLVMLVGLADRAVSRRMGYAR